MLADFLLLMTIVLVGLSLALEGELTLGAVTLFMLTSVLLVATFNRKLLVSSLVLGITGLLFADKYLGGTDTPTLVTLLKMALPITLPLFGIYLMGRRINPFSGREKRK